MKKIALVTGATSGIGKAIAKELALHYSLILCGRRKQKLVELETELREQTDVCYLQFDVSDKSAVKQSVESLSNEWKNIDIAQEILKLMEKGEEKIEYVTDRPGHDLRYAIDASKIQNELAWRHEFSFEDGLKETVNWYKENQPWWEPLKKRNKDWKRL